MSRIFEMGSGQIDFSSSNEPRAIIKTNSQYPTNELALRLLTVAESQEQRRALQARISFLKIK